MIKRFALVSFSVFALLTLLACGQQESQKADESISPNKKYIGKWIIPTKKSKTLELTPDKTAIFIEDGEFYVGKWSEVSGGRIKVEVTFSGNPMVFLGGISTAYWYMPDGKKYSLMQLMCGKQKITYVKMD